MADTSRNYKIVPLDAERKTISQRTQELEDYLTANIAVATADGDLSKAALFQERCDALWIFGPRLNFSWSNVGTYPPIRDLRLYLAANVDVAIAGGNLSKAALFQQHLDTLDMLIARSRD